MARSATMLVAVFSTLAMLAGAALSLPEGVTGPLPFNASGFLPWNPAELQAHLAASAAAQNLSVNYHKLTCPRLRFIVMDRMYGELMADSSLAAGIIRLYFNDCFPNGCDASILLVWPNPEMRFDQNNFLNRKVWDVIESIRKSVHAECGPTVSCADILALAARDAVIFAGGLDFEAPLGRLDSLAPAIYRDVSAIPLPTTEQASVMLNNFASRGFNHPGDLVAFSGAHSIGKAHCASFRDRADRQSDDFSRQLFMACRQDVYRLQELDHVTPNRLDNQYYRNLMAGEGVFTSDMALLNDPMTASWVTFYQNNPRKFLDDFSAVMSRLYTVRRGSRSGEIRRYGCFKPNSAGPGVGIPGAAGADQEGAAASA
ncbi:unnamed protein product [Urochloa decumbens]|uniref:Peroxidase n=1 Tax=Urochloa decumbens TaxID=240449 RepID=A0ABC9ANF8_9POAL